MESKKGHGIQLRDTLMNTRSCISLEGLQISFILDFQYGIVRIYRIQLVTASILITLGRCHNGATLLSPCRVSEIAINRACASGTTQET